MSSKEDYLRNGGPVFEINSAEIDKNPDGLKPDNTDLKRTTKKTLKDYLSDKTSINQFPVDKRHDENKPDTKIYGDSEGKTSPELKINDPDVNEHQYKPQFLQKERVISRFNPGKLRDTNLDGGINGNNLLNDWDYTQTASDKRTNKPVKEVVDYTNRKLSANRFSDNNEYGSNIGDKTFSIKKRKSNSPNSEKRIDLSVDQLNEIASYLMLKASGKDAKPGESSMFVPGIQQLIPGTKLNGNRLNVNQIVKDLYVNEEDKDILGQDSGQYRNSFGVLNNYFDRFEKTSIGTLALSASIIGATIAALLVAAAPYALLIQDREIELDYLKDKGYQNKSNAGLPENRKLRKNDGTLQYKKPSDIIPTFEYVTGIESSRFKSEKLGFWSRFADFYLDLMKGGQIFFSLNGNALALLGSFGYYSNFCRSIVRDTFRIIELFTPKNGESDLEYTDNMISYDTLQIVKNSKLTKCMNLFIKLSDIQKDSEKNIKLNSDKNRLALKIQTLNVSGSFDESKANEELLPFYFKDLRNDKIVQFYATLSEFSETYSPQWVEEHYYGRVDPIKFYKSTTRKISLNFKVFSYDEADYKEMWKKLQDLTSFVYPTYTDKRVVETDKKKFEVPFSQTFKSQPLIRVKLGDLITNNIGKVENLIKVDDNKKSNVPDDIQLKDLFDETKISNFRNSSINQQRKKKLEDLIKDIINNRVIDPNNIILFFDLIKNGNIVLNTNIKAIKSEQEIEFKNFIIKDLEKKEGWHNKGLITFSSTILSNAYNQELNKLGISDRSGNIFKIHLNKFVPKLLPESLDVEEKDNPFYKAMHKVYGEGALAYVDNLSYKTMEGYQWEIDDKLGRRPRIIDVNMELTIIHDIQPFSNGNLYTHRQGGN